LKKRKWEDVLIENGQHVYRSKGSGLICYPGMPQKMHGPKEAGRPDFDLTPFDEWPRWMQNLDSEHASIELTKDGYVIFWAGTVHDGIWCGDDKTIWMGGRFRDGIVLGGHFFNCDWITGEKRDGHFHSGIWHNGLHRGGSFSGLWLTGTWMGGTFDGFRHRTNEPPPLISGNACIY
jgi:hypothetical protein